MQCIYHSNRSRTHVGRQGPRVPNGAFAACDFNWGQAMLRVISHLARLLGACPWLHWPCLSHPQRDNNNGSSYRMGRLSAPRSQKAEIGLTSLPPAQPRVCSTTPPTNFWLPLALGAPVTIQTSVSSTRRKCWRSSTYRTREAKGRRHPPTIAKGMK